MAMMTGFLWALFALVSGVQLTMSTRYQSTRTSRQGSYRYAYPSSRAITGPNVCKGTCCPGWQLNAYTGRCTIPICRPPCRNGGRCLRPNQCTCSTGYYGSYCQYEVYIRPNTGPRPSGGSSASSSRTSSTAGGSMRPAGNGGYSRTGTIYRPAGGSATTTTVVRPGSSSSSGSSRTYIPRIRPALATSSGTNSRTYSLTYTSNRGNVVSANNGYKTNPASPITPDQTQSDSAVGLPSSHGLARFTMRGPCFRRVNENQCMAPLSDVTTLHDDCCATVGQGWGNGCYACPQMIGREVTCPRGFKKSPESGKCIDVDECEAFDNICMHGSCLNSRGSYRCRCDDGYMSDSSGTQCLVSVKQICYTRVLDSQCYGGSRMPTTQMQCCCSLGLAWGTRCQRCPYKGSAEFRAMCPQGTGYHYKPSNGYNQVSATVNNGNSPSTHHLDPCATISRLCLNGECVSTGNGRYTCECSTGFTLSSRGNQCIDVNECRETRDICGGGRCLNSYGSYHCICAQGLVRRSSTCEDVDECTSRSTNPCGEYVCLNTRGSFHCSRTECSEGYSYDNGYRRCVDVNECQVDNVCEYGRCINVEGSYHCLCSKGFASNPTQTDCIDVDECAQDRDSPLCGGGSICINEVGSYRCHCAEENMVYDTSTKACTQSAQGGQEAVDVERKDCYGSISDVNFCSNILGSNVTQQECCCTVGAGWGDNCDLIVCPSHGSATYNATCPVGKGKHIIMQRRDPDTGPNPPVYPDTAVYGSRGEATISGINECEIFPEVCGTATCIDRDVLFECTCERGYKFDEEEKTCTAINHCLSSSICGNGTCTSTESGPVCGCPSGYRFNNNLRACQVEDYCALFGGACGNGTCVGRRGGYDCRCPAGHRFSQSASTCQVNNFCVALPDVCGNGTCIPTASGYVCRCPTGFQFDEDVGACLDIDLCRDFASLCGNGTCHDLGERFICTCPEGFRFTSTRTCLDLDECATASHSCGSEARCINTPGSHRCVCQEGFHFNPDTRTCDDNDECRHTPNVCGNATCTNTVGSYQCSCQFGYTYDQTRGLCLDSNECSIFRGICSNGTCMNTQGSYKCVCPRGYEYISGSGHGCIDINECNSFPGICGSATCFNREGDFQCSCEPGYTFNEEQRSCEDLNECRLSPDICGTGQCENNAGSFRCICDVGSQFDETRRTCIALASEFENNLEGHTTSRDPDTLNANNDCLSVPDLCGNGTCAMGEQGTPICTCQTGYQFDNGLGACVDIEECERNPRICGTATCSNRIGGYTCVCSEGYAYKRKKKTCADLNECRRYPTLCKNGRCVNRKGSFACLCAAGQQFDYQIMRCVDMATMNACSRNPGVCGNGTCTSSGHSIRCLCPSGFDYNPSVKQCLAINDCEVPNRCGEGAVCEDTESGYRCICMAGYMYNEQDSSCRAIPQQPSRIPGGQQQTQGQTVSTSSLTAPARRGPNECNSGPCVNGICVDRPQGFICQCTAGYRLVGLTTCQEIPQPPPRATGSAVDSRPQTVPAASSTSPSKRGPNECESSPCVNGVCVDRPEGFLCQCTEGYQLVDDIRCEDINECDGPDSHHMCMFGNCVNEPLGSYTCTCPPPLTLDSTGRRCIELLGSVLGGGLGLGDGGLGLGGQGGGFHEEPLETCWGQAALDEDICSTVVSEQTSYQACCCGTGVSWGSQCFSCPLRDSEEYRMLCVPISEYGNQGDGTHIQVDQSVHDTPGS